MENNDKIGLFDFTTNFCEGKIDLRNHPRFEKDYTRFMVNRVLSMSPRTCLIANFINRYGDIPKAAHFDFMNQEVDPEPVFFNYAKATDDNKKEVNALMAYFETNTERALEHLALISCKRMEEIVGIIAERDKKIKKAKGKKVPK